MHLVTWRLAALVSATAALSLAAPYYQQYQQHSPLQRERQLLYQPPLLPYQQPYSPFAPQPLRYQHQYQYQYQPPFAPSPLAAAAYQPQLYYSPHASSNLISPASGVAVKLQQQRPVVLVQQYPGGPAVPLLLAADQAEGGSWWSDIYNNVSGFFGGSSQSSEAESPPAESPAESPAEGGQTPAAAEASGSKGEDKEKNEGEKEGLGEKEKESAKEGDKKGDKKKAGDANMLRQQLLAADPQFFGHFGGLANVNPALVVPSAGHGAVSSYLFLKSLPFAGPQPFPVAQGAFAPPKQQPLPVAPSSDATGDVAAAPGDAALEYQRLLQASRQQKEMDDAVDAVEDDSAVAVDAKDAPAPAAADDPDSGDENGTSDTDTETATQ